MPLQSLAAALALLGALVTLSVTSASGIASAAPSTTIVINELRSEGPAGPDDEFVELRNVSAGTLDIGGWRLAGCNGAARLVIAQGVQLGPGEHYLLAHADHGPDVAPDRTFDASIANAGGFILQDASGGPVDTVAFGPACAEGQAPPNPARTDVTKSASRDARGTDTDDNRADFSTVDPTPTAADPPPAPPADGRLSLFPESGTVVTRTTTAYGRSADSGDALELSLDGRALATRPVLDAPALLTFAVSSADGGLEGGSPLAHANAVVVGDGEGEVPIAENAAAGQTVAVAVPGRFLTPGPNQLRIVAGPTVGSQDLDDFDATRVRLVLADGTVLTDPESDPATRYLLGDSEGAEPSRSFTFAIPDGVAGAVAAQVDTTTLDDGAHTLLLEADGPRGAAREESTFTVDNTAPAFESVAPVNGARLKGEFTIDATARDGEVAADVVATLDGERVALGSTLSTDDLDDGAHALVFTATDRVGNTATRTVTVTTVAEQPGVPEPVAPAEGARGVATDADLRVRAEDPAGDELTVTALEARVSRPQLRGTFGGETADEPPEALVPGGDRRLGGRAVLAAARADDVRAETGLSETFPYQRYALRVQGPLDDAESIEVSWEGHTAPDREVVLSVFDLSEGRWEPVDSGRGSASGADVRLRGPVDPSRALDGDVVHVMVQGRDPFADDIDDPADGRFEDPSDYDFSIAFTTDSQYLSEGAAEGRAAFEAAFTDMADWIVDNAAERKIEYVVHAGDIVQNSGGDEARARREFQFASDVMDRYGAAGLPYGVLPGNHDNEGGGERLYNEYFGPDRFESATATADQDYYAGPWRAGDNANHYDLFSAGGIDFMAVHLGWSATQEEIDWVNQVLAAHRDRKAIFVTHSYLVPSGAPDGRGDRLSGGVADDGRPGEQGQEFLEQIVLPNENVFLVLSGHHHGVAQNVRRDVGADGRAVVELLGNYQDFEVDGERRSGHFRLLQFDVDRSEVAVDTYSPTLDDHNADEFDVPRRRYEPQADEFTFPVDLPTRTTGFGTDEVTVEVRTGRAIGSDRIASGAQAAVTWRDLAPRTEYAWYARAADDFGGVAESDVVTFMTGPGKPGGPGGPGRPGGPGEGVPGGGDGRPAPPRGGQPDRGDPDDGDGRERPGSPDRRGGPGLPGGPGRADPAGEGSPPDAFTLTRLAGAERAETAARISAATFAPGVDVAYVATMADFPDALTGAPLAGLQGAPVLLVGEDVPRPTRTELERLRPGRIAVLGGPHVVPASVEQALAALTGGPVDRVAGDTRFGTAAAVAAAYEPGVEVVFIASGAGFPDALTGGAAAAAARAPLLLVADDEAGGGAGGVPIETRDALERLRPGRIVVLGGQLVVPGPVVDAVGGITGAPVERLAGADRYATAAAVSSSFAVPGAAAFVASGADFPDALTAVPAAAAAGTSVILTPPVDVPASVTEELERLGPSQMTVVGGETAVPIAVVDRLEEAARR